MQTFLMCPPEYFNVDYVINPWMTGNVKKVDASLAMKQWLALYEIIRDHALIRLVQPKPSSPDMVFTANAGLVMDDNFIISRFKHHQRRVEEIYFREWFLDHGWNVMEIPNKYFEGAGDGLFSSDGSLWLASGHRSDGVEGDVHELWNVPVMSLKLVDPRFYHLDTCFCPLGDGYVMFYPPAFDDTSVAWIRTRFERRKQIEVGEEDALKFACNAVNIDNVVILNKASYKLQKQLSEKGFTTYQTPLSEFMKAGGSAKCLTLRIE